jgi:hypothetical protein
MRCRGEHIVAIKTHEPANVLRVLLERVRLNESCQRQSTLRPFEEMIACRRCWRRPATVASGTPITSLSPWSTTDTAPPMS